MTKWLILAALIVVCATSCRSYIVHGPEGMLYRGVDDGSFRENSGSVTVARVASELKHAGFTINEQDIRTNSATLLVVGQTIDGVLKFDWTNSSITCLYDSIMRSQSQRATREVARLEEILKRVTGRHGMDLVEIEP